MKEGPLFKLTITEGGQQTTQYKKMIDDLPVLCADKGFRYVGKIIRTETELVEATFKPTYPDATQWSTEHEVYVEVVIIKVLFIKSSCRGAERRSKTTTQFPPLLHSTHHSCHKRRVQMFNLRLVLLIPTITVFGVDHLQFKGSTFRDFLSYK